VLLHRSLSQDELHGLREMYPAGVSALIHGLLKHPNTRPVIGAQVVAVDGAGRPCAGALSTPAGAWTIYGLDPGSYTLYAMPVDGPVSARQFGAGHTVQTNFRRTELGSASVAASDDFDLGSATVLDESALEFGYVMDDFGKRVVRGLLTTLTLHGSGLVAGCTLACSDPDVLVTPLAWNGGSVQFRVDVPADAMDGNLDLTVSNPAGESRTLVAGLEITPPDPQLDTVLPAQGTDGGGTQVTIHGANFRAGQQLVLGGEIYAVGEPGGCELADANTLHLATRASVPGTFDVVVIDPTGVEGRRANGFTYAHVPEVQSTFPAAGYAGGGTLVVLRGQGFEPGLEVRIDGLPQTLVELQGTTEIRVTTLAGVPGGPYQLEVENPGGAIATSAFSYTAAPDPLLEELEPGGGPMQGGNTITIHGANLGGTSAVLFGADAATGAGGTPAAALTVLDANTLEVVAPAHAPGAQNLLVRNDATGQAVLLPHAYTFEGSGSGGGCYTQPHLPPAGPREMLAGAWWLAALLLALHSRAWQRRASSPSTSR
jgi:hypothetical protein